MRKINTFLLTVLLAAPLRIHAADQDHEKGRVVNTIALMSEEVIQSRLIALGYQPIRIIKTSPLLYQVTVAKEGKMLLLDFHPQLGVMERHSVATSADLMPRDITPDTSSKGK